MTIDVVSLLIGMMIWELVSKYINRCIVPLFKQVGANKKINNESNPHITKKYNGTNVGFTAQFDEEPKNS